MEFFTNTKYDFLKFRYHAIALSLLLIGAGIISLIVKGGPNYGIDFSGGVLVDVCINKPNVDIGEVRSALANVIPPASIIQAARTDTGEDASCKGSEIVIRTPMIAGSDQSEDDIEGEVAKTSSEIEKQLASSFGELQVIRKEMVGPRVGKELRASALWSIVAALAGILVYVTFRFQFWYAFGAVVALVHDVLFTVGIFSLLNKEIDLTVVGALLTIVGFSLNDTIVIFDRVRENLGQRNLKDMSFYNLLNLTINQTLSRTILTSLTVLIVVLCLFFFGGPVINEFSLALLLGVIAGVFSTVFIASALVLWRYGNQQPTSSKRIR